MRQYNAIGLLLVSYVLQNKKRKYLAFVLAVLAVGIHSTSAVVVIAIFVYRFIRPLKNLDVQVLFGAVLTIALGYMFEPFLMLFVRLVPHYSMYIGDAGYTLSGYQSDGKKIIITLLFLAISTFAYLTIKKTKKIRTAFLIPDDLRMQFFFMVIAISLGLAGAKLQLIARMESYFSIYSIVFIPKIFKMVQSRYRKIFYIGFLFIMIIPMLVQLRGNNSGVVPYSVFF